MTMRNLLGQLEGLDAHELAVLARDAKDLSEEKLSIKKRGVFSSDAKSVPVDVLSTTLNNLLPSDVGNSIYSMMREMKNVGPEIIHRRKQLALEKKRAKEPDAKLTQEEEKSAGEYGNDDTLDFLCGQFEPLLKDKTPEEVALILAKINSLVSMLNILASASPQHTDAYQCFLSIQSAFTIVYKEKLEAEKLSGVSFEESVRESKPSVPTAVDDAIQALENARKLADIDEKKIDARITSLRAAKKIFNDFYSEDKVIRENTRKDYKKAEAVVDNVDTALHQAKRFLQQIEETVADEVKPSVRGCKDAIIRAQEALPKPPTVEVDISQEPVDPNEPRRLLVSSLDEEVAQRKAIFGEYKRRIDLAKAELKTNGKEQSSTYQDLVIKERIANQVLGELNREDKNAQEKLKRTDTILHETEMKEEKGMSVGQWMFKHRKDSVWTDPTLEALNSVSRERKAREKVEEAKKRDIDYENTMQEKAVKELKDLVQNYMNYLETEIKSGINHYEGEEARGILRKNEPDLFVKLLKDGNLENNDELKELGAPKSIRVAVEKYRAMKELNDTLIGDNSNREKLTQFANKFVETKKTLEKHRDSAGMHFLKGALKALTEVFASIAVIAGPVYFTVVRPRLNSMWRTEGRKTTIEMQKTAEQSIDATHALKDAKDTHKNRPGR